MKKKRRALISVSDKTGLIPFAHHLAKQHYEILSTGGTLRTLRHAGIQAKAVEDITGFPEILEGRVKTLHPKIHGGLLYRRDKTSHKKQAKQHGIEPIDLAAINLYPFEKVTRDPSVKLDLAIENIDIGGPSMIRSAAKNYKSVAVVCDPEDYPAVIQEMHKHKGQISQKFREHLALKAFERTAAYDQAIAGFLSSRNGFSKVRQEKEKLPFKLNLSMERVHDLRYGENPHQAAALYLPDAHQVPSQFKPLHGKELSYNNLLDIEGAIDIMREFQAPAAVVVKHSNPCGIAEGRDTAEALNLAIECDAMSAFGGIVAVNRKCNLATAKGAFEKLHFFEVFIAPDFEPEALAFLKKRKNLRVIETVNSDVGSELEYRFLQKGMLCQQRDLPLWARVDLKKHVRFVTKKKLAGTALDDLLFAFKCVKNVKSNAIVLTQGRQTVGIGAGQMSRIDAVEIACRKAGYRSEGTFLASDAFFPMPDSIEYAHEKKILAIIQPGGSIRDQEVIEACNRFDIVMAFTGERHFKH